MVVNRGQSIAAVRVVRNQLAFGRSWCDEAGWTLENQRRSRLWVLGLNRP